MDYFSRKNTRMIKFPILRIISSLLTKYFKILLLYNDLKIWMVET